eukprot:TRINITY_DN12816_c0_g1_i1.p1 TRINITY_DN12816_c0_g1~~TRINITY_DN12816_c0_g1_i1.p1  ORF type:complete len:678 (+),score=69.44 TRINITY_DN12816_c0_g1_i1:305-2035(+)
MPDSNSFGGDSIQVDRTNVSIVYYAGGMYDYYKGCVFKSLDQGNTWTCTLGVKGGSNQANRFAGERIFVDYVNGSRLLFGSRYEGLHQSTDAAQKWTPIGDNIPLDKYAGTGIPCIFADPTSVQTQPYHFTKIIYLLNYNDSVYQSNDGGDTWLSIGGPKYGLRGEVSPDGRYVYVTGGDANSTSAVHRLDTLSHIWSDITPNKTIVKSGYIYDGVTVHASNPKMLIAATRYPDASKNPIYRSLDNGRTWSDITPMFLFNSTVPWWSPYSYQEAISCISLDPFDPNHAWVTDFSGTWTTHNLNDSHPVWTSMEEGHEELVVMTLASPPKGNLQSGTADANGFNHINLNQFPFRNRGSGDTTSIDYAALMPSFLVSAQSIRYENTGGGYYSVDGGASWIAFKQQHGIAGKMTVSADGSSIIWAPNDSNLLYSNDNGTSWVYAKGDIAGVKLADTAGPDDIWHYWDPLYADRVNPKIIYCAKYGIFYRSNDGGLTWRNISSVAYSHGYDVWGVKASSIQGDVWYWSSPAKVLQHSTDYGDTWRNVSTVTSVSRIAFGKKPERCRCLNPISPWDCGRLI